MALENRRRPSINEFLIIFEWRRAAGEWSFNSGAVIGGRCDNDYPPSRNFFVTANSPPLLSVIIDWVSARIIWSFFCFFHKNSICCLPRNLQTNPNEYLSCPICCDYRCDYWNSQPPPFSLQDISLFIFPRFLCTGKSDYPKRTVFIREKLG